MERIFFQKRPPPGHRGKGLYQIAICQLCNGTLNFNEHIVGRLITISCKGCNATWRVILNKIDKEGYYYFEMHLIGAHPRCAVCDKVHPLFLTKIKGNEVHVCRVCLRKASR